MKSILVACALWLCLTRVSTGQSAEMDWLQFPDKTFQVDGLPWFRDNAPELWRLPAEAKNRVPPGVWNRAVAPDGGRIRFASDTSTLALKVRVCDGSKKPCFFDAYTNGVYAGSAKATGTNEQTITVFETKNAESRDITIYLPNNHEVRVLAVGLSRGASLAEPKPFRRKQPIVCYGSSVLQGTGSAHPSKTYPAVVARQLNLDFVNLGFGGAGKAEAEVVDLVKQLNACGYIFDLGKSYGAQTIEPYARMLETIRTAHPKVPIFCVTPIYSTKEATEPGYFEKSEALRKLMRQAAMDRQKNGDKFIYVVEGPELFGEPDKDLFNDPLHPNDAGNERIAHRLAPKLEPELK